MVKLNGQEVVVCADCQLEDGEPILHVLPPHGQPCWQIMEELEDQRIAAQLREDYWGTLGQDRGPWEQASAESKTAWLRVVRRARELL